MRPSGRAQLSWAQRTSVREPKAEPEMRRRGRLQRRAMGGILFNLSAATLGNIVGGVLVGMAYWYIYAKRAK